MTVEEIINQVRWCIDEESNNSSDLSEAIDDKDDSYMDNIIKAKISDALRWVCMNAPEQMLLSGSSDNASSIGKNYTFSNGDSWYNQYWREDLEIGIVKLPSDVSVIRMLRVRGANWHRAVLKPVEEDSDEELAMFDESARGTLDRPQVAIMRTSPIKLMIQPATSSVEVTLASSPSSTTNISKDTNIDVQDSTRGAFIYYLAFLLLSAYDDTKASVMYSIALQQLGITQSKQ